MGQGMAERCEQAALGYGLDLLLGEAPSRWHPLVAFGSGANVLEGRLYKDRRAAGSAYAALAVGAAAALGVLVRSVSLTTYLSCGARALGEEAQRVRERLSAEDLSGARACLRALAGRDSAELDESEVARAVVESVAENTVDAVVAPIFYAMLGGAPLVLGHRAVNTLDALVGYHNERYEHFGWASARLDDLAAFLPARLLALLVLLVRPRKAGAVFKALRQDAPAHPSPNAGVAEAAFAGALGLCLGGPSSYGERLELRPYLGRGRPPQRHDIDAAIALSNDVALALVVGLVVAGRLSRSARRAAGRHSAR